MRHVAAFDLTLLYPTLKHFDWKYRLHVQSYGYNKIFHRIRRHNPQTIDYIYTNNHRFKCLCSSNCRRHSSLKSVWLQETLDKLYSHVYNIHTYVYHITS